jgi:hypothetical protein
MVKANSNSLFSNFSRFCMLFPPNNDSRTKLKNTLPTSRLNRPFSQNDQVEKQPPHPSLLQPDSKQHNEGGVAPLHRFPNSP